MELQTTVQVSSNQIKRQEEDNRKLYESLEKANSEIKLLQIRVNDHKRKYSDLESQVMILSEIT